MKVILNSVQLLIVAGIYIFLSSFSAFALPIDLFETTQNLSSTLVSEEKVDTQISKESIGGTRTMSIRLISGSATGAVVSAGITNNGLTVNSLANSSGSAVIKWTETKKAGSLKVNSVDLLIAKFEYKNNLPAQIEIRFYGSGNKLLISKGLKFTKSYSNEFIKFSPADEGKAAIDLSKVESITLKVLTNSNALDISCLEINGSSDSECSQKLNNSLIKSSRSLLPVVKKNQRYFKIAAKDSKTKEPVYLASVTFVTFKKSSKGKTNESGEVVKVFKVNETVAASITAQGFNPTTTKSVRLKKNKILNVSMNPNGKPKLKPPAPPGGIPGPNSTAVPANPNDTPLPGVNTPIPGVNTPLSTPGSGNATPTPDIAATLIAILTGAPTQTPVVIIPTLPPGVTPSATPTHTRTPTLPPGTTATNTPIPPPATSTNTPVAFFTHTATATSTITRTPTITLTPSNTATPVPPTITTTLGSRQVIAGTPVSFSMSASGATPMSFQWLRNGNVISGATTNNYSFVTALSDDGVQISCRATNAGGIATSNAATVNVGLAPAITAHPVSQTVEDGVMVTFSVTATGTGPVTYQWKRNGVNINLQTSPSFTLMTNSGDNNARFTVQVTTPYGTLLSNEARLTVNTIPRIQSITNSSNLVVTNTVRSAGFLMTFSYAGTYTGFKIWRYNGCGATDFGTPVLDRSTTFASSGNFQHYNFAILPNMAGHSYRVEIFNGTTSLGFSKDWLVMAGVPSITNGAPVTSQRSVCP